MDQYSRGSLFLRRTDLGEESSYRVGLSVSRRVEAISGKTADERFDLRIKWDSLLDFKWDGALYAGHCIEGTLQDFSGQERSCQ